MNFNFINILSYGKRRSLIQGLVATYHYGLSTSTKSFPDSLLLSPDTSNYILDTCNYDDYWIVPWSKIDKESDTPHSGFFCLEDREKTEPYTYKPFYNILNHKDGYQKMQMLASLQRKKATLVLSIDKKPELIPMGQKENNSIMIQKDEYMSVSRPLFSPMYYRETITDHTVDALQYGLNPHMMTYRDIFGLTDLDMAINEIVHYLNTNVNFVVDIVDNILYGNTTSQFLKILRDKLSLEND